jgi:hypothetical protein
MSAADRVFARHVRGLHRNAAGPAALAATRRNLDDVLQKLQRQDNPSADEPTETEELDYQGFVELDAIVPEAATSEFDRFTAKYPEHTSEAADPYFRRFRHTDNAGRITAEYLVPRDEFGSKSTWIYCLGPPPERPGRTQCTVEVPFGDQLWLKYAIPRRHLAEWRVVDVRVKAWVRTLIVLVSMLRPRT